MLVKLEWLGYHMVKKLWRYVKPFSSDTGTLRTDGQTDVRTDLLYQYRTSVCWRAIKISTQKLTLRHSELQSSLSFDWVFCKLGDRTSKMLHSNIKSTLAIRTDISCFPKEQFALTKDRTSGAWSKDIAMDWESTSTEATSACPRNRPTGIGYGWHDNAACWQWRQ